MPGLLELARQAVKAALTACLAGGAEQGAAQAVWFAAVDGTCGNGHDTLFLARELEELAGRTGRDCRVLAVDIQARAVAEARKRLEAAGLGHRAGFVLQGHEHLGALLENGRIAAAMYNLGYLPGSDKTRTTQGNTTLISLRSALGALMPEGVLSVHAYGGHAGGEEELLAVQAFFRELPFEQWAVACYDFCNKPRNPERLFLATPRRVPGASLLRKE